MKKLEDSLPLQLLRARESSMNFFRPVLQKAGFTEQQWRVLRVLNDHEELEARQLAHLCCILSPSLTRIVTRFEEEGFIARKKSPQDQRISLLSLTPKAISVVAEFRPEVDAAYQRLIGKLGEDKLKELSLLLSDVIALESHVE
ncbi:homoprotocatechuate degradation operon regulator HpaR [Marinomonas spartinae]|uniref:homoprotocatechuate degradation operon regulator HpaR n=1 Tax=Marinomonas spartinae TaxID=1792290 RepID=UPI0018F16E2A|nr:homoprotocatechuate degradation operon regulator HpaR [Marinomonas spartinae]MBJ7553494.1 homoprotocatechuate degradation operon regulator HpaR [Marinomonas spartinae]